MADASMSGNSGSSSSCEGLTGYTPTAAILDGKFFTVTEVSDDGLKIKAVCNNCTTKTIISGSPSVLVEFHYASEKTAQRKSG